MRIAVASDDRETIAGHFGRALGFMVFQCDQSQSICEEYRTNNFTGHAEGAAPHGSVTDHHGPILRALADCDVVISHGMGRRIHEDLRQAGIQAIITEEVSVERAVKRFIAGDLENQPELYCNHGRHHHA